MRALSLGFYLVALGMFWLDLINPNSPFYTAILFPTLLIGVGLPIIAITTNILGGKHVQTNEEGLTSGLLTTFQQFGSIIGLAVSLSLAGFLTSYVQIEQNYIFADACCWATKLRLCLVQLSRQFQLCVAGSMAFPTKIEWIMRAKNIPNCM